jgi:uncharacterized membrane protein
MEVEELFFHRTGYKKVQVATNSQRNKRKTNFYMHGFTTILPILALLQSCTSYNSEIKFSKLNKETFIEKSLDCQLKYFANKKTTSRAPVDSLIQLEFFLKQNYSNISKDSLEKIIKGISKQWEIKHYITNDKDYVSYNFLTHQNSLALKALEEASWNSLVSIKNFTEYILPYKQNHEIVDHWRDSLYSSHKKLILKYPSLNNLDSLYLYHKIHTYPSLSKELKIKNLFLSEDNFSWLNLCKEGDCFARCRYMIYYLRAAGAPATFDYLPSWGNRPYAKHSYVGLANKEKQLNRLLENNNDPHNVINDLNACMTDSFMFIFQKQDLPDGLYIQYEKTIPKVFRETWGVQKDILKIYNKVPAEEIITTLITPNSIDVTDQYLKTANVELNRDLFAKHKISYLTVFNRNSWLPVAYSLIGRSQNVTFNKMGKNIVYLPMVMENEGLIPKGDPFILNNSGKILFLSPDYESKIRMKLIRKYPLFAYSSNYTKPFKDAAFQGCNNPDFVDKEKICTIDKFPFYPLEVEVHPSMKFKYIRLCTENNEKARINLLELYTKNRNGEYQLLKGKISRVNRMLQVEFDSPMYVSKIKLWPRNDENYIIPGNEYELMYWDNEWKSCGVKTAKGFKLEYDDIPSKTLYWLRCLSEGKEERIFTYENGIQRWW